MNSIKFVLKKYKVMRLRRSNMLMRQIDKKLQALGALGNNMPPEGGWVHLIRTTLNMSLRQLASKMKVTPQSVKAMEKREQEGTITLNALHEAAKALDMKLVYAFIPIDGSLENMVAHKAYAMASEIVNRTSMSMKLEGQENSAERIKQATDELAYELTREIPKKLWD